MAKAAAAASLEPPGLTVSAEEARDNSEYSNMAKERNVISLTFG
jgi:hypothetical protein